MNGRFGTNVKGETVNYYILDEEQYHTLLNMLVFTKCGIVGLPTDISEVTFFGKPINRAAIDPFDVRFKETSNEYTDEVTIEGRVTFTSKAVLIRELADDERAKQLTREHICNNLTSCIVEHLME